MIIDGEKLKYLVKSLSQESHFVHPKSHVDWPGLTQDLCNEKPAGDCLSYGITVS